MCIIGVGAGRRNSSEEGHLVVADLGPWKVGNILEKLESLAWFVGTVSVA